jgi:molecular chaperone GrpE (heat shock protein)
MERCANTEALNIYEREQDKAEKILEHEQRQLSAEIDPYIDGLNNAMRFFAYTSVMDKQAILEYVKETLDELLEIR